MLLMLIARVGEMTWRRRIEDFLESWSLLRAREAVGTLSRGAESNRRALGFRKPVKTGTSN